MREIIFRGKAKLSGMWIEGSLIKVGEQCCILDADLDVIDGQEVPVIPETVGQFTGLLDKNGNKIFEGDIVKTEFGRLCIFEWFENRVTRCWDLSPILTNSNLIHPAPYRTSIFDSEHLEVVGNIHDNPELLEE